MIAIVNIDENPSSSGPQLYELRINNRVVTRFTHNREEPLHECLLKAAIAAQEKAMPKDGMIRPFFEPLYDEVYLAGMKWLDTL